MAEIGARTGILKGEHVNRRDIRKHKNDVFRLTVILKSGTLIVAEEMRKDMRSFISEMRKTEFDTSSIGLDTLTKDQMLDALVRYYCL